MTQPASENEAHMTCHTGSTHTTMISAKKTTFMPLNTLLPTDLFLTIAIWGFSFPRFSLEQTGFGVLLAEGVGEYQQHEVYDGVEQGHRGGIAVVGLLQALAVHKA